MTKRYKALGVHTFTGGFTLGVKRVMDIVGDLEARPHYGSRPFRDNFPEVPVYEGDWPIEGINDHEGVIDLIFANPPCAPFTNNQAVPSHERLYDKDPRCALTKETVNLLGSMRPRVLAYESVTGAWAKGREMADGFIKYANELGYHVTVYLHDTQYLGLGQKRKRYLFIASTVELKIPEPSWETVSAAEVLRKINDIGPIVGGREKCFTPQLLAEMKPGELASRAWERLNPPETWVRNKNGHVTGRPSCCIHRLPLHGPGPAVLGYPLIHPTEDRSLGLQEVKALAGFDPLFEFKSLSGVLDLISRGVTPAVGEHLARIVEAGLNDNVKITVPGLTIVDHLKPSAGLRRAA